MLILCFTAYNSYSQDSLFNALKKDNDFLIYCQIQKNIYDKLRSGYFIIPSNYGSLGFKNGKPLDKESLKIVLRDIKMKNSDEFIDLMAKQQDHLLRFFSNNPKIKLLESYKQKELFQKLLALQ